MASCNAQTKDEGKIRSSWKIDSLCLVYSRADKKWYDGKIVEMNNYIDDEKQLQQLSHEWLTVRYKDDKKTKKIQRNCAGIKPIPTEHVSTLKTGSICLIYSNIIDLWCKGEVISVFNDKEGEWLKVRYWDTNDHKICEIQRYSKDLKIFNKRLLWKPKKSKIPISEPWILINTNMELLPHNLSNVVRLNDNEFIVAPWHSENIEEDERKNNGIYKYNIIENEWKIFILYPDEFLSEYHNMSIDYDKQIIYLFYHFIGAGICGIWKINMKTEKFEWIPLANKDCSGALTYIINSELNIFWGLNHNKHLLWNNKELNIIHQFDEFKKGMICFGMVYHSKEEYFLLFGGYKGRELGRSDEIWRYFVKEQKWEKLEIKMPDKMQSFGCVITSNCKYILIFGGSDSDGLSNKIYVLDLYKMQWNLSKILCPFNGVGYGNVILTMSDNTEYVNLLQGQYCMMKAPVSAILH